MTLRGKRLQYAVVEDELGLVVVATGERGVASILFGDDRATLHGDLVSRFPEAELHFIDRADDVTSQVIDFIRDPRRALGLPLDIQGTEFQRRVWAALMDVPAGHIASYVEIARRIGVPAGARAIAGACSRNVLAVAIPCHRIIGHDGAISGYAWGAARKRALLDREAAFTGPYRAKTRMR